MPDLISQPVGKRGHIIGNEHIRLQFDLRTTDTMYNFVWIHNPKTGQFERLYNFGADVWSLLRTGNDDNFIGMNLQPHLSISDAEVSIKLISPSPLVQYRQFEKAP